MKTYYEQKYKHSIEILVKYHNDSWIDGIKGLNKGHALYLARLNWPGAKIIWLQDVNAPINDEKGE
jgi:hypothetical protein